MIAQRQYRAGDMGEIFARGRPWDRLEPDSRMDDALVGVTILLDGKPVGLFGGSRLDASNNMRIWAVLTEDVRGYGLALVRMFRSAMAMAESRYQINAMYTWCSEEAPSENAKLLELLQFRRYMLLDIRDKAGVLWKGYVR